MRRILALLGVGALAALAVGSAAALNVTSQSIQAGGDTSLTCDDDGAVSVDTVGFDWSDTEGAYVVTGVIVSGIGDDCEFIDVTFTDINGDEIASGSLGGVGASATVSPSVTVTVAELEDIHVLLTD